MVALQQKIRFFLEPFKVCSFSESIWCTFRKRANFKGHNLFPPRSSKPFEICLLSKTIFTLSDRVSEYALWHQRCRAYDRFPWHGSTEHHLYSFLSPWSSLLILRMCSHVWWWNIFWRLLRLAVESIHFSISRHFSDGSWLSCHPFYYVLVQSFIIRRTFFRPAQLARSYWFCFLHGDIKS